MIKRIHRDTRRFEDSSPLDCQASISSFTKADTFTISQRISLRSPFYILILNLLCTLKYDNVYYVFGWKGLKSQDILILIS